MCVREREKKGGRGGDKSHKNLMMKRKLLCNLSDRNFRLPLPLYSLHLHSYKSNNNDDESGIPVDT